MIDANSDGLKRTKGIRYDAATEPRFTYEYGANGAVGRVKDAELGREARMAYDLAERPVEAELYENGALQYRLTQEYDRFNQPSVLHERVEEPDDTRSEYTISAEYDIESKPKAFLYESARMTEVGEPDKVSKRKLAYTYDGLGRMTKRRFYKEASSKKPTFQSEYTYLQGGHGRNSTTPLVKVIKQAGSRHEYWYDSVGNITRECQQGNAMVESEGIATKYTMNVEGKPLFSEEGSLLGAEVKTMRWPSFPIEFGAEGAIEREAGL